MFRIRSADKGKPLLVSSLIIDDYSDGNLDTLHKKNLLALGEDRYLTTLILKHFPTYKTKFIADAKAQTVAPHSWGILLSQRRRWINSTVHNLAELMFLPNMCGFCCFSMRFVVFIDLLGTIILPATFVYLVSCSSSLSSSVSRADAGFTVAGLPNRHGRDWQRSDPDDCHYHDCGRVRSPGDHLPAQTAVAVHRLAHHLPRKSGSPCLI